MNRRGFTLLEVLVSLALFTIIRVATAKHLQQVLSTKNVAFNEIQIYDSMRTAISIMRYDLSQAFHILYDDLGEENKQLLLQNQAVPHTLFDGRKSEMVFTSLSHRVYYLQRRETEQAEISYYLQNLNGSEFPSLMKRETGLIDDKPYEGGSIYTIIDNVFSMSFQYWDGKTERWVDDWSSDDGQYRDKFPDSVKMELEVIGDNDKRLKVTTQFKIASPNNKAFLVKF